MDTVAIRLARVEGLRAHVNQSLSRMAPDHGASPGRLTSAMSYAVLAPGKRVRAVLLLLCATLLGGDEAVAMAPACALEMVHAASLILDDLPCMDDAATRRGLPSTHLRYGEDMAVLAGVALLNEAYAVVARAPGLEPDTRLEMVRQMAQAVGLEGLASGQASDLGREEAVSVSRIEEVHRRKTGALFEAAAVMGGLAAGAQSGEIEALRVAARDFGLVFQTLDDVADGDQLAVLLGGDGARSAADRRLALVQARLSACGPQLQSLAGYMELLLQPGVREASAGKRAG